VLVIIIFGTLSFPVHSTFERLYNRRIISDSLE